MTWKHLIGVSIHIIKFPGALDYFLVMNGHSIDFDIALDIHE